MFVKCVGNIYLTKEVVVGLVIECKKVKSKKFGDWILGKRKSSHEVW